MCCVLLTLNVYKRAGKYGQQTETGRVDRYPYTFLDIPYAVTSLQQDGQRHPPTNGGGWVVRWALCVGRSVVSYVLCGGAVQRLDFSGSVATITVLQQYKFASLAQRLH